jgi:hypothetical protein
MMMGAVSVMRYITDDGVEHVSLEMAQAYEDRKLKETQIVALLREAGVSARWSGEIHVGTLLYACRSREGFLEQFYEALKTFRDFKVELKCG